MSKGTFANYLAMKALNEEKELKSSKEFQAVIDDYVLEQVKRIGAIDLYQEWINAKEALAKAQELEREASDKESQAVSAFYAQFVKAFPKYPYRYGSHNMYPLKDWVLDQLVSEDSSNPLILRYNKLKKIDYNSLMMKFSLASGSRALQEVLDSVLKEMGWSRDDL